LYAPILDVIRSVTGFRHNRGTMMHDFIVGAIFVAIVLIPCVIVLIRKVDDSAAVSESDVLEDGFI
jgi:hypothetical protein